jgi:flagellar basal body-associated protein FliL
MSTASLLILILVFVLVLLLFAALVWLFVLLSRGKMQPREDVQGPVKARGAKNGKPRR